MYFLCLHISGDRTPKQKVKMKVTQERLLNLMLKYNGGRPRAEVFVSLQTIKYNSKSNWHIF